MIIELTEGANLVVLMANGPGVVRIDGREDRLEAGRMGSAIGVELSSFEDIEAFVAAIGGALRESARKLLASEHGPAEAGPEAKEEP